MSMSHYSEASSRTKSPSVHGECRCGLDAPLMTSWTDSNPGRRFYGCGMYKIQGYKRCNHFVWYDEKLGPRAKEMISTLKQKLKIANLKIDAAKIQEDEMSKKIRNLNMRIMYKHVKDGGIAHDNKIFFYLFITIDNQTR
ncbi:uncharacterized protein At4g04775-like [Vicia villosa]|uniref:uncharacterized protein At4g04775-like n=1 Tax=Vicia villosa TaxID=3911 RepID=UPI00273A96FE|nr:uncharacterized protein At4g04775-like [Vicia villosa]